MKRKNVPKGQDTGLKVSVWSEARKARGSGVLGETAEMGGGQILESLVSHAKNVFNQSRLEENSTDLDQMLGKWELAVERGAEGLPVFVKAQLRLDIMTM